MAYRSKTSKPLVNYGAIVCMIVSLFTVSILHVRGESEDITEDNWDVVLEGHWMIKFYAPWCPACKNLRPTWDKFAVKAETLNVRVAEVDVTKSTALSGRFGIVSLPTIYHALHGEFRLYQDKRKIDDLVDFIKERKWEKIEPVPSWKSPGSYLMSGLGLIFKASVVFKNVHTTFTETYGLPAWGSYVIFGVVTVLIGLMLGMFLVCLSDFFFGVLSSPQEQRPVDTSESERHDDADDESGIEDLRTEVSGETENDPANSEDASIVRKRPKKLKATTE